jgi:hypothetical protein
MTGIILILFILVWGTFSVIWGKELAAKVKSTILRPVAALLFIAILFCLPLADEIIGLFQFKALCDKNGISEAKLAVAKGMTLKEISTQYLRIENTLLNVTGQKIAYVQPVTNVPIVEYTGYRSEGGWLIRMLGISETKSPLIFEKTCGLPYGYESMQDLLNKYQIKFNN